MHKTILYVTKILLRESVSSHGESTDSWQPRDLTDGLISASILSRTFPRTLYTKAAAFVYIFYFTD